ncbi:MAG: hypothetical protein JXQ73_02525 [Phycisphaerae bacterium]|nr:hypothetical protein [Phycisphaerae bacterium]
MTDQERGPGKGQEEIREEIQRFFRMNPEMKRAIAQIREEFLEARKDLYEMVRLWIAILRQRDELLVCAREKYPDAEDPVAEHWERAIAGPMRSMGDDPDEVLLAITTGMTLQEYLARPFKIPPE